MQVFRVILLLEHLKFFTPVLVLVSQLEVYYKLDRFLSVLTAQQIVTATGPSSQGEINLNPNI